MKQYEQQHFSRNSDIFLGKGNMEISVGRPESEKESWIGVNWSREASNFLMNPQSLPIPKLIMHGTFSRQYTKNSNKCDLGIHSKNVNSGYHLNPTRLIIDNIKTINIASEL